VVPPVVPQSTFDGNWSSDDGGGDDFAGEDFAANDDFATNDDFAANDDFPDSDDEPLINLKPSKSHAKKFKSEKERREYKQLSRDEFWSHKAVSLAGRIACKYCDTIFETKDEQIAHECKYLQCNKRNFICRVCNKELSRKTFSNHLHETLACKYCNKKFVNPRSMKTHILRQHKGKELVAPRTYKDRREILMAEKQENGNGEGPKKKVYPKKKMKLECGKISGKLNTAKFIIFIIHR
jgi:Zinc finger, C2H2 type